MAAASLILLGCLASIATTSAQQRAIGGGLRRFRFFNYKSNNGVDSTSYFDESPLIHEAFGDFEDIAETEYFFRNLGSMSSSTTSNGDSQAAPAAVAAALQTATSSSATPDGAAARRVSRRASARF